MVRLWIALLLVALPASLRADEPRRKLNVLLIMIDDLRNTLGCYGNAVVKTPNIDRLAAKGVKFERAYVQYPVCNPSRCSLLTGRRPDDLGVTDNRTLLRDKRPDVVTLPELLKNNGWHTEAFGKIFHLGGGRNAKLRERWMDSGRSWHRATVFGPTEKGRRKLAGRNLTGGALKWCHWGMMAGDDEDQPDGQNAKAVIDTMTAPSDKPWLLAVGFHKPHDPFLAPKKYFDRYPEGFSKLYRDPEGTTKAPPLAVGFGGFGRAFAKFTDKERLEFLRAYYACTSFMDAQVGRILDTLDKHDLWKDTLVIFMSDHGYHLGERDWWNKNTLFERSCRTPLIVVAPGAKPGTARGLIEFVDVFPTVTDYLGIDAPKGLAGHSIRELIADPSKPGKEAAYTIVTRGPKARGDSVRTDRWRYTKWSDGTHELYDHARDGEETRNVASAHPDVVEKLRELLAKSR